MRGFGEASPSPKPLFSVLVVRVFYQSSRGLANGLRDALCPGLNV